jgi:outer membrane lipoprotein SlyB
MKRTFLMMPVIALMGVSTVGCAGNQMVQTSAGPMPAYCTQNNAATGAIVGGLLGAGLGAAIGGGRGAAIGAAAGATFGGLSGAQADQQCQQLAYQQAAEMAFAAQAQAAYRGGPPPMSYNSYNYVQPSTGATHTVRVTPLSNQTAAASGGTSCVQVSDDTGTKRVCKTADGKLI